MVKHMSTFHIQGRMAPLGQRAPTECRMLLESCSGYLLGPSWIQGKDLIVKAGGRNLTVGGACGIWRDSLVLAAACLGILTGAQRRKISTVFAVPFGVWLKFCISQEGKTPKVN